MTTPKDDFLTSEQLNEKAGVALSDISYTMGLLLGTISRLERENEMLRADRVEALELLQRGRDYADEIDLDVGWQMDVDVFLNEHRGFEREKEPDDSN